MRSHSTNDRRAAQPAPIANAYWVMPERLLAGGYPGIRDPQRTVQNVRQLLEAGIALFLDLTEEGEYGLQPYAAQLAELARGSDAPAEHRRVPIPDMTTPSLEQMVQILDTVDSALERQHGVYVHCFAGLGRTGTVVGCWLARHGTRGESALKEIARLRRQAAAWDGESPTTVWQQAMVRNWPAGL